VKKLKTFIVIIASMVTTVLAQDPVPNTNYDKDLHNIILTVGNVSKTQYFVSSEVHITENGKRFSIKYYRHGDFDKVDTRMLIGTGQMGKISKIDSTDKFFVVIYVTFKKTAKKCEKETIEVPFVYQPEEGFYAIKPNFKIGNNKYEVEGSATLQVSSKLVEALKAVGDNKVKNKEAPRK
jgi:hypothetical protein